MASYYLDTDDGTLGVMPINEEIALLENFANVRFPDIWKLLKKNTGIQIKSLREVTTLLEALFKKTLNYYNQ